jgi:hypothetical protein
MSHVQQSAGAGVRSASGAHQPRVVESKASDSSEGGGPRLSLWLRPRPLRTPGHPDALGHELHQRPKLRKDLHPPTDGIARRTMRKDLLTEVGRSFALTDTALEKTD